MVDLSTEFYYIIGYGNLQQQNKGNRDIFERLKIKYKESQTKFSRKFNIAQNTLGRYELCITLLSDELKQRTDMENNLHWLITGEGLMPLTGTDVASHMVGILTEPERAFHKTQRDLAIVTKDEDTIQISVISQRLTEGFG